MLISNCPQVWGGHIATWHQGTAWLWFKAFSEIEYSAHKKDKTFKGWKDPNKAWFCCKGYQQIYYSSKIKVYDAHIVFREVKGGRDAFSNYDSNTYYLMFPLHSLSRNRPERGQSDLVDKVPSLQPLLRSQLKLLVVEKTIVEALLDALVVQVLPDEHQLLASVAPRPRLIIGCLIGAYTNNIYIRKSTSPFSWDKAFRISGSLGDPCQRCLCRKRIEDLWKSEGSSYLNSQSHGLYGLILTILPACWTMWKVWLLASIIKKT